MIIQFIASPGGKKLSDQGEFESLEGSTKPNIGTIEALKHSPTTFYCYDLVLR